MTNSANSGEVQSLLLSTKVGELVLTVRPTLTPQHTVGEAAREMRECRHGSVTIFEAGRLAGIFTERDLLRYFAKHLPLPEDILQKPLSEVMTRNPAAASVNDTLFEATRRMDEGGYRRLPVLDEAGTCVGFVDVKTITHFLVENFPAAIYNQASYQDSLAKAPEGA
jgi:CBS domain-containing protein